MRRLARSDLPAALLRAASTAARCGCAAVQELLPAAPGTVSPYKHHVFIRSAPPEDLAPPEASKRDSPWWPSVTEKLPVFARAFLGVARNRAHIDGTVKVTAYDGLGSEDLPRLRPDECDLMFFPDGVEYRGLPVMAVGDIVAAHVTEPTDEHPDFEPPRLPPVVEQMQEQIEGLRLFVCCHSSRDARCGALGEPLARRLDDAAHEAGLSDAVQVLRCSHIGGHKYAGNVVVYGPASPCDGDWYGGLRASDARPFLQALLAMPLDAVGGPADPLLARHWRGRMGLAKDDQVRLAAGETLDAELSEEEEEEEESGDDLSEGERVRFDAPWGREEQGDAEEHGGAIWDRRSFASLADGDEGGEDDQESSSDWDSDEGGEEGTSSGSSSESDSDADDPDTGPPLR